ncbi:MAG: hypothetical protein OHK0019_36480 [Saprospiraceae bacterium]
MKNFSDIQALLDRYWEGETTLEEERALKAYFASGEVDERLRTVAPLFQALREEQTVQYAHRAKAATLKPVLFNWQKMAVAASVVLMLSVGFWWWSDNEKPVDEQIAAQLPVLPQPPVVKDTSATQSVTPEKCADSDPTQTPVLSKKTFVKRKKPAKVQPDPEAEMAMEEIKAALALVSSKLRKGRQEAAKGAIHLENVDKVFKKKSNG